MTVASSTFTGSENPLSESGMWTSGPGAFDAVQKVSGVLQPAATGGQDRIAVLNTTAPGAAIGADQYSKATIGAANTASFLYLAVRVASGTDGSCYFLSLWKGGSQAILYRVADTGTLGYTNLSSSGTISWTAGDVFELRVVGTTITAYQNTNQIISPVTDATYTSGQPGLGAFHGTNLADATWADWEGGDYPPTSGLTIPAGDSVGVGDLRFVPV